MDNIYTEIYKINQFMKRFISYIYIKKAKVFVAVSKEGVYQIIYAPEAEITDAEVFQNNWKMEDGRELFNFLKDKKELFYKDGNFLDKEGNTFSLTKVSKVEIEEQFNIELLQLNEENLYVNGETSSLYYKDELIAESFNANDIVNLIKRVSEESDHVLPILGFKKGKLIVYSEFTQIPNKTKFLILDIEAIKALRVNRSDSPYFELYKKNNSVVINYGSVPKNAGKLSPNTRQIILHLVVVT